MIHRHHIIPRHEWRKRFGSLKGFNGLSNTVLLTIEQHAQVHQILWEYNGSWEDKLAWKALSGQISMADANLEAIRAGGFWHKGIKRSLIARENYRRGQLGSVKSPETRLKISSARRGQINNPTGSSTEKSRRVASELGKTRVGKLNPFFGHKHSNVTRLRISETKKRTRIKESEQ